MKRDDKKGYGLTAVSLLALVLAFSPARAAEIADDTLLLKLPVSSKLVVTGDLSCHQDCMCAWDGSGVKIGDNRGADPYLYTCNNFALTRLRPGAVLPIKEIKKDEDDINYVISSVTPDGVPVSLYLRRYRSKQVGGLKQLIYGNLSLAYDDPYAGLAPEVVTDIVMGKIVGKLKKDDYVSALDDFKMLEKLRGDAAMPESFYYYYALALQKSGDKANAQARASAYLKKYGKRGKYYDPVVKIMSDL